MIYFTQEFQEFADGSGDTGFIVFSTGSIVARVFHSDLVEDVALVLKKLPYQVIWKHDGPRPKNVGPNTKISAWIPQNALLGKTCLDRANTLMNSTPWKTAGIRIPVKPIKTKAGNRNLG